MAALYGTPWHISLDSWHPGRSFDERFLSVCVCLCVVCVVCACVYLSVCLSVWCVWCVWCV